MNPDHIVLSDVSKFYGEVLGVNRVNLDLPPGPHRPGRAERLGQVDPDAPGHRSAPAEPRQGLGARHRARASPRRSSVKLATAPSTTPSRSARPASVSSATAWPCTVSTGRPRTIEPGRRSSGSASPTPPQRKIAGYSKGMRQRVKLAPRPAATTRECSSWTSRSTASTPWGGPRSSPCSGSSPTTAGTSSSRATSCTRSTRSPTPSS